MPMIDKSEQIKIRDRYMRAPMEERTELVHTMAAEHGVENYDIRCILDGDTLGAWAPKRIPKQAKSLYPISRKYN